MREFKDCVPADARAYYIELFKHRTKTERAKYDAKLLAVQNGLAAQGVRRSGHADKASWDARAEFLDAVAIGCVEDALAVYEERELVLTPAICTCLADTAREHLDTVYRQQLKLSAERLLGFHLLNSSIQEMSTRKFAVLPRIKIVIERARLASARRREDVSKEKQGTTINNNYTQNIFGSNNTGTTTGDVIQHYTTTYFHQLAVELELLRNTLKSQLTPIDAEDLKLLEDAENAAKEHNETKLQRCLGKVSEGTREVAKSVGAEIAKQAVIELIKNAHHFIK